MQIVKSNCTIAAPTTTTKRHIEDFVPWPESELRMPGFAPTFYEAKYFASPTGILPIKTHLLFDAVPQEHVAKKNTGDSRRQGLDRVDVPFHENK